MVKVIVRDQVMPRSKQVDSGVARVLESLDTRGLDPFLLTASLDAIEACVIGEFHGILKVLDSRINTSNEIRVYLPYVR